MDRKDEPEKKKLEPASARVGSLLRETEENLQSWIEDSSPLLQKLRSLSPDEQENFFFLLIKKGDANLPSLLNGLIGQEEKLDLTLAQCLGHWVSPQAAVLLHRLAAAGPSRVVAKVIRKSIFRLKSKGLPIEEIRDQSPAIYQVPALPPSEGFLSAIDSSGQRIVFLARPQIPQGVTAFSAVISDSDGMVDFSGFETSRKNFHEYLATFQGQHPLEIIEADPEYCAGLIVEASEIGQEKGKTPSEEFLKLRPLMGSAPSLPLQPLIYQFLDNREVRSRPELLDRSASLFQSPYFQTWFLEKAESQKYLTLLREASASPLVLTPYQKESRLMEIYQQAVHEIFVELRRLLYRRRLEEMAYILWKKGQEDEARISLAAALALEKESSIFSPHPFLLELVKRSLLSLIEEEKEKKKEKDSGLIIRP